MAQIKKRGDTYTIMVSLGYDNMGKQIRKYMTYKPEKSLTPKQIEKEVQRQAVLFEDKCKKGLYLDGNIAFSEFAEKWFADYAEKQLKAQTLARYRSFMKRVNAAIGHIKLDKLQPHHLTEFYNNLKEDGVRKDVKYKSAVDFKKFLLDKNLTQEKLSKETGVSVFSVHSLVKGNNINYDTALKISECLKIDFSKLFFSENNKTLSDKTIHHYHAFISSVLSTAVLWQVILTNPCERVKPPKFTRKEAKYLDEDELAQVLTVINSLPDDENQNCLMIKVLLSTGLRRGELCGLKYDDIDFENRTISVNRNLLYLPDKGIFENTPKTESSIRVIPASPYIIQSIKEHKILQKQRKIECGDKWNDTEYIFTAWNGSPLHPDTISGWFRKLVKKYDLPNVSIHSLRHTAATILLMKGLPARVVAELLGHVNEITTATIYSHVLKSVYDKAADIMDDVMSGKQNRQDKKKHG
ncbi:MAG: tyrosine-type recombinase/integrase [Oscillospiraceae bacterium]|nr:tyrosine-type recombinase/integrase [Oscillospiraceae bacterium]